MSVWLGSRTLPAPSVWTKPEAARPANATSGWVFAGGRCVVRPRSNQDETATLTAVNSTGLRMLLGSDHADCGLMLLFGSTTTAFSPAGTCSWMIPQPPMPPLHGPPSLSHA